MFDALFPAVTTSAAGGTDTRTGKRCSRLKRRRARRRCRRRRRNRSRT